MANTTETATFNVKSNIGEVGKDAASAAGEFRIMGVSLNSVKAGFISAGTSAKAMFGSIKAGLISTGIGAFVVLIGSLVSYFTNTKRGADKLAQAFTAMGAVVDVLTDRLSSVGEALSFVFSGEFKKAGEALKGTFSGITDEVTKEVAAMVALKQRTQELRDADMDFMVQKAATRQEIEKARLIAEDETKSAQERLKNLKTALELEAETTEQEIALAKERMAIQEAEMKLSENSAEDEQRLAQLKTEIIEKETASIKMRRRVVTEVNALEREIHAEEKARAKEKQDEIDAKNKKDEEDRIARETKARNEAAVLLALQQENTLALIDDLKERALAELKIKEDKEIAEAELLDNAEAVKLEIAKKFARERGEVEKQFAEDTVKWSEMSAEQQRDIASSTAGNMATILGEETAAGKAFAITQATIDTFASAQAAYKAMAGIYGVGPVLAPIAAAAAVAAGMKNIAAIKSTGGGGGGGGGGNLSAATTGMQPPAPQMMSGAFELGGGIPEPEPIKAFVVTDEMTNSQDQLANIRRRATI
tara:strand:- start:465 stop:2069 length:1605 start_codon:yes stop_codon:yes gene_type:complete